MTKKLSDWANVAEIIGSAAIVVSLIYVGIQVNDSTREVRSANANNITAALSDWYINVGINPQASETFLNGMAHPDSLSPGQTAQFIFLAHSLMLEYQAAYYLAEQGTLDVGLRQAITNNISGTRALPGMQLYWTQRRSVFEPGFREFVDTILTSGATDTEFESLYRPKSSERE